MDETRKRPEVGEKMYKVAPLLLAYTVCTSYALGAPTWRNPSLCFGVRLMRTLTRLTVATTAVKTGGRTAATADSDANPPRAV